MKGVLIPLGLGAALLLFQSIAPDVIAFLPMKVVSWVIFATFVWGTVGLGRSGATLWVGLLAAIAVMVNPIAPLGWPTATWETWADRAAGALAACAVIRRWE